MVCEHGDRKLTAEQTQRYGNCFTMFTRTQNSHSCIQDQSGTMSDKPFACKIPGCNQKFVNEDHLEVHRRKHDASLGIINLKSLDTPVIADQTPTPTRFLKNLAGDDALFNDLSPNPFDAMFKRASTKIDSNGDNTVSTSETPVDVMVSESSIMDHSLVTSMESSLMPKLESSTNSQLSEDIVMDNNVKVEEVVVESSRIEPQIIADIGSEGATLTEIAKSQGATTIVVVSQAQSQTIHLQTLSDHLAPLGGIPLNGPIMIKLPTGQTIPVLPPSVTNPQMPIPIAVSANPSKEPDGMRSISAAKATQNNAVKLKLKSTLLSNQSQGNMSVMAQAVDVVTRQQEVASVGHFTNHQDISMLKRQLSSDDDSDSKRQKFLERNRAAASRCRNKRKQWITDLEKRADDINLTNNTLSNEVTKLRNEVAQLKELLLAHKDCPVTMQQRAAGMFMRVGELPSKSEQEASSIITLTNSNPS